MDALAIDQWAGAATGERIAIPVPADRTPATTTHCAVAVARQAGLAIEFVSAAEPGEATRCAGALQARCEAADAAGAPRTRWRVLAAGPGVIESYITWSGASLRCVGTDALHHQPSESRSGASTVPVLVIGPTWQPSPDGYHHLVVGLDSSSGQCDHVVAAATRFAELVGADLTLIEVVDPGPATGDVAASAHLHWVAHSLVRPPRLFDTVAARRPAPGLGAFLGPATIVVVGAPRHRRWLRRSVAGRLVRRAPCPVLVVPPPSFRT